MTMAFTETDIRYDAMSVAGLPARSIQSRMGRGRPAKSRGSRRAAGWAADGRCDPKRRIVSSVATTETLEEWYRAYNGNDAPDDLDRKSLRRSQFPPTIDPSEPASPGRARLAF